MNEKTQKIKKMSKILYRCMNIGAIILVVTIAAIMVLCIVAPSFSDSAVNEVFETFSLDFAPGGKIVKNSEGEDVYEPSNIDEATVGFVLGNASPAIAGFVLTNGFMAAILFITGLIFRDISRAETPFVKSHSNRLKVISLIIITLTIIVPPLQMLLTLIFAPGVRANASINISNLVFAAVFYCLAMIFEYGAELQQFSDEAL